MITAEPAEESSTNAIPEFEKKSNRLGKRKIGLRTIAIFVMASGLLGFVASPSPIADPPAQFRKVEKEKNVAVSRFLPAQTNISSRFIRSLP